MQLYIIYILITTLTATQSAPTRPNILTQFTTQLRAASGYGHSGDGCILANAQLQKNPTIKHLSFDAPAQKIAQTNPNWYKIDPNPKLTIIGDFSSLPTPTETDIDASEMPIKCYTESINGTFGTWGELFTPFTSVLGMFYLNTTLLSQNQMVDNVLVDKWQWTSIEINVPINVNNSISYHNITRNYTYDVAKTSYINSNDIETYPLLRFTWTQSIPLQPALPIHRDCFVFDFTKDYVPGPVDPSKFLPPKNITCTPREERKKPKDSTYASITPSQQVYNHVQKSANLTFRPPSGILKYKYLVGFYKICLAT